MAFNYNGNQTSQNFYNSNSNNIVQPQQNIQPLFPQHRAMYII